MRGQRGRKARGTRRNTGKLQRKACWAPSPKAQQPCPDWQSEPQMRSASGWCLGTESAGPGERTKVQEGFKLGARRARAAWHREWDRERLDIPGRYILLPRSVDVPLHRREAGVEGHRAGPDKRLPIRPVSLDPPTAHAMVQPDAAIPLLVVPVLEVCPPSRRRARRARRRARRRALLGSSSVE